MAFEMERNALLAFLQELVNRKDGKPPTDKAFANIEEGKMWLRSLPGFPIDRYAPGRSP